MSNMVDLNVILIVIILQCRYLDLPSLYIFLIFCLLFTSSSGAIGETGLKGDVGHTGKMGQTGDKGGGNESHFNLCKVQTYVLQCRQLFTLALLTHIHCIKNGTVQQREKL